MTKRTIYEIQDGDSTKFITVKRAEVCIRLGQQFLRYELSDGTVGLKRPGTWRIKESN